MGEENGPPAGTKVDHWEKQTKGANCLQAQFGASLLPASNCNSCHLLSRPEKKWQRKQNGQPSAELAIIATLSPAGDFRHKMAASEFGRRAIGSSWRH